MSISSAFRNAFRICFRHPADTLKFLATELCLVLICLAPVLFLADAGLRYLAVLAVPMWILIMFPARMNAAEAMQDSLRDGRLFSWRLADPSRWGDKVLCGLKRAGYLLLWASPLIAAAVYAWRHFSGLVDGFTLLAMIKQFGGGDFMTGVLYLLLVLLAMVLILVIGFGFHSGARHARAQGGTRKMKGRHGKNLLGWICAQATLLPVLAAFVIAVMRYLPVIRDVSGLMTGSVKIPPTRETLMILAAGALLTLPLLPVRSMITAAVMKIEDSDETGQVAGDAR